MNPTTQEKLDRIVLEIERIKNGKNGSETEKNVLNELNRRKCFLKKQLMGEM